MYLKMLEQIRYLRTVIKKTGKKFMYAENFVYAPAVRKTAEIIKPRRAVSCS